MANAGLTVFLDLIEFAVGVYIFLMVLGVLLKTARDNFNKARPWQKQDAFMKEFGYSWTYVFVFEVVDEDKNQKLTVFQIDYSFKMVCHALLNAGFDVKCFYSAQKDECYVKVRIRPDLLKKEAQRIKRTFLLDPNRLKLRSRMGHKEGDKVIWAPINLVDTEKQSPYGPYENIYSPYYTRPELQSIYTQHGAISSVLKGVDRISLMMSIFESKSKEEPFGCHLNIAKMRTNKCFISSFPLHDFDELKKLQEKWLVSRQMPNAQPFDDIRNYYGEKIALYFLFIGHYCYMLMYPSIIGCIVQVAKSVSVGKDPEFIAYPLFSAIIIVWSSAMLENWKRLQAEKSLRWGTSKEHVYKFNTAPTRY